MAAVVSFLLAVVQDVAQLVGFLVLAPLIAWCLREGAGWLNGAAVPGPGYDYRQHEAVWRRGSGAGFGAWEGTCLAVIVVVMLALPLVTTGIAAVGFADPLALGVLLLGVRARIVSPFSPPLMGGRLRATMRTGLRPLATAFVLLCLVEALVALAAPGADGVSGLCTILRIEPVQGLEGALAACGVALLIACPPLRPEDVSGALYGVDDSGANPGARAAWRVVADLFNAAWLLFLADLAVPSGIGVAGSGAAGWVLGLGALVLRVLLAAGVAIVLRVTAQECGARLTALFAGLGLLIALAGRFGT